jgi:hypothetical protein
VAFYLLDDAQLWFHRMELNGGRPTWTQFVKLVNARFRLPLTDSPISELTMLCRSGSVDEFSKRFIALSCRDTTLSKPQQIQLFIMGLGDPLRMDVAQQQPASLDDVVIFTRTYEQHNAPREAATPQQTRSASRYTPRLAALPAATTTGATPAPSTGSVNKPATTSIRLSPFEIAWRRKDDKCFKCDEFFTRTTASIASSCSPLWSWTRRKLTTSPRRPRSPRSPYTRSLPYSHAPAT